MQLPRQQSKLELELGRHATKCLMELLGKLSDEHKDWRSILQPELVAFRQLATISDADRYCLTFHFLGPTGGQLACEGSFEITRPLILSQRIEEVVHVIQLETEHACARAVDYMLGEYQTTFDQQWDLVNRRHEEKLQAEGRAAFQAGLVAPQRYRQRRKGVRRRVSAPWHISR